MNRCAKSTLTGRLLYQSLATGASTASLAVILIDARKAMRGVNLRG